MIRSRILCLLSPIRVLCGTLFFFTLTTAACSGGGGAIPPPSSQASLTLTRVAGGFAQPVTIVHAGDGSGRLFVAGLRQVGTGWQNELLADTTLQISTFGEDETGELYVADYATGDIYRIGAP
jgi:hypothetical protein